MLKLIYGYPTVIYKNSFNRQSIKKIRIIVILNKYENLFSIIEHNKINHIMVHNLVFFMLLNPSSAVNDDHCIL